ncbi:hypothetical protein NE235_02480 [Actinoallomurus spadix]|uniref:Uncharacterized protein n=1 Tax=Actinoallomurus spadix TaxID=79912 RepID=A0ABN0XJY6_9ACTN|nr:hypothetical protein [Actinoallomurus spadix]MCO5984968.1 hypothetical protein [Actinoallomurus spadix]
MVDQPSLFAPDPGAQPAKPPGDQVQRMRVLITVKAAPNPSSNYGETVCVAALRLDFESPGWVRLYPINFRELDKPDQFHKYDIVSLDARPNHRDPRRESWRPLVTTLKKEGHLREWKHRLAFITDHIDESMCGMLAAVRTGPPARSLGVVRPRDVGDLHIQSHPGWTPEERTKIDRYVSQEVLGSAGPRTALEAPRFKAWYRYRCQAAGCKGHRQGLLDWEWVAHQRRLTDRDDAEAKRLLRRRWLEEMCAPDRDVMFFVGNQAKNQHVFSVLGVAYPRRQ